jgi:hypothetical protein
MTPRAALRTASEGSQDVALVHESNSRQIDLASASIHILTTCEAGILQPTSSFSHSASRRAASKRPADSNTSPLSIAPLRQLGKPKRHRMHSGASLDAELLSLPLRDDAERVFCDVVDVV